MNPACVGFIPADTESEESYTTIWNAYRKALHVLLYKVKRCCIHACVFCTELENILSHPLMAAHKDSVDFTRHKLPLKGSLGDQGGGGHNFSEKTLGLLAAVCCTHATIINRKKGKQRKHFKNVQKYEEWYDMVMVISTCPFETLGFNLQTLAVKWLREEGETAAADWFQQYWTGPRNGRWMLANTSYGNVTNNNCLESWWRWMKEYTCQKKRVAMCMFLGNLFKHLRAESEEACAKLRLAGLSGKFESNPQLSKKGWKYVQGLDHRTFRMCKVVQGNSTKFHNLVEEVMCLPGYENDILAHQFMEHGEGGPDLRLTLQDVWEVHMPTQWYINKLVDMLEKEGAPLTMEVLLAENKGFHDMFMKLKDEGDLEGKHIEFQLDIMRSFVILTALPQEWNKETKHTCICRSFFKHGACEHAASMAMSMDHRVQLPKAAVMKRLQHRPRSGREPTKGLGKDEGSAFSKDKREYQLPTVRALLT